jgi:hypothetical protein
VLTRLAEGLKTRIETMERAFWNVREAVEKLARSPGDPKASLVLGKFQCYRKRHWVKGLALLAAGSDAGLAALARKDLSGPAELAEQTELGHAWWDRGAKETGLFQRNLQRHAREWFLRALPRLSNEEQDKIGEKLKTRLRNTVYKPGLVAELFADEEWKKRVKTRLDYVIGFNWGFGAPAQGMPADHFSIRWTGWLLPPEKGIYTLYINADDGARIKINGRLVLDTWRKQGKHSVAVPLTDKQLLTIEYHEGVGTASIFFSWIPPGGFEQPVPMEALYHTDAERKVLGR